LTATEGQVTWTTGAHHIPRNSISLGSLQATEGQVTWNTGAHHILRNSISLVSLTCCTNTVTSGGPEGTPADGYRMWCDGFADSAEVMVPENCRLLSIAC